MMAKGNLHKNAPLVSICIPVYNGARFITQVLESIRNQTYVNLKCHIVNNASTDDTEKFSLEMEKNDERFKVHTYNDFANIVTNWNRTVNHIDNDAKYFKVVQADDYLAPDSIESMVDLMEKYPSAGIGTSYRIIGDKVYGFGINYFEGNFHNGKNMLLRHLFEKTEVTGSITQLFFRIEHLKKVETFPQIFNPEEFHDDTRLAYEMMFLSDMVFAFKILNFTRRHQGAETITTVDKHNTLCCKVKNPDYSVLKSFFLSWRKNTGKRDGNTGTFCLKVFYEGKRIRYNGTKNSLKEKLLQRKLSVEFSGKTDLVLD
jgi:glycosyltransferase involved in cell wall biosynthesis